ncbi:hypothetical protein GCM10023086_08430 [Streptomyces venetus]|uniref:Uncharacterized protein n=1 Tax=Streptomyces venetus TaxID=1701086 RepID=A0ABP8F588_9ACTN
MRLLVRSALAGTAATLLALTTGASAHADGTDRTVWASADWNVTPKEEWGGKAHIQTYGEIFTITDLAKDGHSTIGIISIGGEGNTYYYWNRDGVDTTRTLNLDIKEGTPVNIKACIGDWSGSPTAGIMWDKCSSWAQTDA